MSETDTGPAAFSTLYRTHARDVHRFALFLSGDPALADDLVSETFIRMWHARARLDLTTVKGYLFAIARNLYVQERRRIRRTAPLDDTLADPQPGPHRRTDGRHELRTVLAALQSMPEVDRAAVLMRAEAGMPYAEIASALRISESAARVKVHRARVALSAARQPMLPASASRS